MRKSIQAVEGIMDILSQGRREALRAVLALVLAPALPVRAAEAQAPLKLATHPYASTLSLIATHRPLQQYLGKSLQRPVDFFTAANFDAFVDSLMAGEYDIVLCPPHFAVLAAEKGYLPLFHYQARLEPILAVRRDGPIQGPLDLRGKTIAMADRSAFIRIVIVRWLADHGLKAGRDYRILERPTHAASMTAAAMGEADAGLATTTALKQLAPDVQAQLRAVSSGLRFPHLFTLVHRRLGAAEIERVRAALQTFSESAPEGREFFAKSAYIGFEPVTEEAMRGLRPYAEMYRQMSEER
jgi:phosphonate transport system substrate-binding protein